MEKHIHCTAVLSLLALAVLAQEDPAGVALAASLESPGAETPNRFGLSYRSSFNIEVSFKHLGGFTPATLNPRIPGPVSPGSATGYQGNHVYEDGYNLLDDNLNDYGGLHATRNWGYLNSSQVLGTPDNQFVAMHVTSSAATGSTSKSDDDPLHGFEINYLRQLSHMESQKWGIAAAFNFTRIGISDAQPLSGDVNQLTDLYAVPAGGFVPTAPYFGSNSEGPLLGSEPSRTELDYANAASITGSRDFDANLFGFKLGPFVEIPLSEQLSVNVSGGLSLIFVSSDLAFSAETVSIDSALDPSGALSQTRPGTASSNSDLLLGGYVNATLAWRWNEHWTLFGGVELQGAGDYTHRDPSNGKSAEMDLGRTLSAILGVGYSF